MKNFLKQTKPLTFEATWASLQETERIFKEQNAENNKFLKEQIAENNKLLKEQKAENNKLLKEQIAENDKLLKEQKAENDRIIKQNAIEAKERLIESDLRFEKFKDEMEKETINLKKIIGGMGNSNGKVAEAYFVNSFTNNLHFAGQEFDSIFPDLKKNVKKLNLKDQYDIVLLNGVSVVIIEVKYTAEKKNIEQTLKKAQTFKQLFPEYAAYNLYLGLAGLHLDEDVEEEAKTEGIAIIKQVGDTMVIYDEHLKVF
jgi:hypothetical protein